jgi:hypothetical protein
VHPTETPPPNPGETDPALHGLLPRFNVPHPLPGDPDEDLRVLTNRKAATRLRTLIAQLNRHPTPLGPCLARTLTPTPEERDLLSIPDEHQEQAVA